MKAPYFELFYVPFYCFSVNVNGVGDDHAEERVVRVAHGRHIICVFIPELATANTNTLTLVGTYDALHEVFVAVLAESFEFNSAIICHFFRLLHNLLLVVLDTLESAHDDLGHELLGFLWSELVLEERADLIRLLTGLRLLLAFTHI